jgi:hypothetical protein
MTDPVVRTRPVVDELVGDDGAVVLVLSDDAHRVVRISVLGQTIRELAADGIVSSLLERALVDRFGTPGTPDVQALVRAAIDALAAEGLVAVEGH